jgi:hypothetical protein
MREFKDIYTVILPIVKKILSPLLDDRDNIPRRGPKPVLSDVQLIAISLTSDVLFFDSENYLFTKLKKYQPITNLVHRTVYNRRRRKLSKYIEIVQHMMAEAIVPAEHYHVVDSFPLPVCRFARANRSKICKESFDTAPNFGYCAAQKNTYFGYKLHAVCTIQGVFKHFQISKASIADIHYLQEIKYTFLNCVILGDKGYLSNPLQLDLFDQHNLQVITPKRRNQSDYEKYPGIFRKYRKRIETLFSQLEGQFIIRRNYAKSFSGFATRIASKIAALTCAQYVNKFFNERNINEIKYAF